MTFMKQGLNLKRIAIGIAAASLVFGAALSIGTASPVSATTTNVEYGASWSYGSYLSGWGWGGGMGKETYSNLASSSRWKNTTATISGVYNYSGNCGPGTTAYAKQWTPYNWDTGSSYYNIW